MKKLIFTIIAAAMLVSNVAAAEPTVDYDSMISLEAATERQEAAETMAAAARVLGYAEDSDVIREAQAIWWEAQEVIDWHSVPVETRCYEFFRDEMGLNDAAICGILANIANESNFDYTVDINWGYGLVAWCGGRREAAKETEAEYADRLVGQLRHVQKELNGAYSGVREKLEAVSNNAEGAYKAGRIFCLEYEIPVNMYPKASYRGAYARDVLWPVWGGTM